MVNWNSLEEVLKDEAAFSKLMHVLLGLYTWEITTSFGFDLDVVKGKKKFRWPLVFYFLGRYSLLFALIGIAISLDVTVEIDCQAIYVFNQVFGNMAIGIASINLSLRTIAVWSRSIYVMVPIVCLILGHWSLLLHGLLIKAAWILAEGECIITNTNNKLLAATFIYSMAFDFLILILTGYKLAFPISFSRVNTVTRSALVKMVFEDGLIYFIVAFLANLIATIMMLMNLNAVMSVIFNVPAAIASTIVSSRAVRRLSNFTSESPEIFPIGRISNSRFGVSPDRSMGGMNRIAHVEMDTFATGENPGSTGAHSILEYDEQRQVDIKIGSTENYGFEAQRVSHGHESKIPPECGLV